MIDGIKGGVYPKNQTAVTRQRADQVSKADKKLQEVQRGGEGAERWVYLVGRCMDQWEVVAVYLLPTVLFHFAAKKEKSNGLKKIYLILFDLITSFLFVILFEILLKSEGPSHSLRYLSNPKLQDPIFILSSLKPSL